MNYFYDKQIRRYIQQFIRVFSNFSCQIGLDDFGKPKYQKIPVRYGDLSRQAAHIIKENSENKISTIPIMAAYVTAMNLSADRRISPSYRENVQVTEKKYNYDTRQYEQESGNSYSLERHIPVPYDLTMNLDIWTSNTEQKLQIIEQILILFNPYLNLNSSDNTLDWSRLAYLEHTGITWSSASIPQGVENVIDIATLSFDMQIFINPPAKLKKQTLIHTIVMDLQTLDKDKIDEWEASNLFLSDQPQEYIIVAQKGFNVKLNTDNTLSLIDKNNSKYIGNELYRWDTLIKAYGSLNDNISVLNLVTSSNGYIDGNEILGTVTYNENDPNLLNVTLNEDSFPPPTIQPVNNIINPKQNYPGDQTIPLPIEGTRYIITEEIPFSDNWNVGGFYADKNSIIEYTNGTWNTVNTNLQNTIRVVNLNDNNLYELYSNEWMLSIYKIYNEGLWRIYI
jgi:hypothetical protein